MVLKGGTPRAAGPDWPRLSVKVRWEIHKEPGQDVREKKKRLPPIAPPGRSLSPSPVARTGLLTSLRRLVRALGPRQGDIQKQRQWPSVWH
jgi:hypothetical protein